MANSRDFTGKNRKFTGTKGIVTPKGTTGQRVGAEAGEFRFNTTTELMEYYDGNQWKPIDAPPTISSISTSDAQGTNNILNADGSTLHTITITGGNFGIGLTVKFIGNTGTEYTAGNINRVSGSSITCKTTASMGTTDDPYDVQVTNPSGLSALLEDAFSFNAAPVFTRASGSLGNVYNTIAANVNSAGATDAEGNTITYSIISGSLPGSGLTLSSSTGAISGTLSGTPSLGNYPFVVRAATTEGTVERQFSVDVRALPTGGTISTSGNFRVHTFTTSSSLVVPSGFSATGEYLIVAGGGGGPGDLAGGGGAGGAIDSSLTLVGGTTYTITIGGGGTGGTGRPSSGSTNGENTTAFGQTAIGGGGAVGGYRSGTSTTGSSGGSGGGGSAVDSSGFNGNPGAGTVGQGSDGGQAGYAPNYGGGGGGGKSAVGASARGTVNGANGGDGINWKSLGTSYAGGGGGGGYGQVTSTRSSGGAGGGGQGGIGSDRPAIAGGINTGGGGGGGGYGSPGAEQPGAGGGSGIVIVRYDLTTI